MADLKDRISYYDIGGREGEMYKALDGFFGFSAVASVEAVKKKRIIFSSVAAVAAVVCGIICIRSIGKHIDDVLGFGAGALAGIGALVYYLGFYTKGMLKHRIEWEHFIEIYGLESIYVDFLKKREITASLFVGDEYLYLKGDRAYRLRDITEVFLGEDRDAEQVVAEYYVSINYFDEGQERTKNLVQLPEIRGRNRKGHFAEIANPIYEAMEYAKARGN